MVLSTRRAQTIAAFMVRIAPSEAQAVEVTDVNGQSAIIWHVLPTGAIDIALLIWQDGRAIQSTSFHASSGEEPEKGTTTAVATTIHSDDEIARKILVHGVEWLRGVQRAAAASELTALADTADEYADAIDQGLLAWGGGSGAKYERPGGHPSSGASAQTASTVSQFSNPDQPEHPLVRVRRMKARTSFWLAVNVIMAVVGIAVTIGTYQAAGAGDRFLIWWGPVIFGVINAIRLAVRGSRLGQIEREIVDELT